MTSRHPALLALLPAAALALAFLAALPAWAQAPGATVYGVAVKVIEANRGEPGPDKHDPGLAPALASLAKDLRSLPFDEFKLLDSMTRDLERGESFTLQVGRPQRARFLRITAEPQQLPGKLKVAVTMEQGKGRKARQEFHSAVSIPEGGTLVVAVTRKGMPKENMLLLAISAEKPRVVPGAPDASFASTAAPAALPR